MPALTRPAPLLVTATVLALPLLVVAPATTATPSRTTVTQSQDLLVQHHTTNAGSSQLVSIPGAGTSGPASPYPLEFTMGRAGIISRVVVLLDLNHSNPDDLDVLLVGPHGQQALVMSDAGGTTDLLGTGPWLNIADAAGTPFPDESAIAEGGSYQPADYGAEPDVFPAPAPPLDGNTSLSAFNGTDAKGTWQLFVVDDKDGDVGNVELISLAFVLETSPYPSTLDVSGVPGTVTDLDVVLDDVSTSDPDIMNLLLVGPGGQQTVLMDDAGSYVADGTVITLDDEAPTRLPFGTIQTGRYRPTTNDFFAAYFAPPAPPNTNVASLAVFDGTDPNGTWRLFGSSDTYDNGHEISGWSLDIEYADSVLPAGSVTIASGAARIASRTVPLTLTATDSSPGAGVAQVRFSNDGGNTWSPLQPYTPNPTWTLATGDGDRTVTVQVADGAGNLSAPFSDSIAVDTTAPKVLTRSPRKDATGVKRTAPVKVFFTEALDPATVRAGTLTLRPRGSTTKVKATWSYNAAKGMLVVRPKQDLQRLTKYQVTLAVGPEDLVGNAFDAKPKAGLQPLKWVFTTR